MPTPNRPLAQNKYPEQYMQNTSFDEDFGVLTFEPLGYDGQNLQRTLADNLRTKIAVDGTDTYVGLAAPKDSEGNVITLADALWQAMKVDVDGNITWADGDANFDNVATDLTLLTYL